MATMRTLVLAPLLLHLCHAWIVTPHVEDVDIQNVTDDCSSYTYEAWLELQPPPVHINVYPGSIGPEEAEVVIDYVEPDVVDNDYSSFDNKNTDEDAVHDDDDYEVTHDVNDAAESNRVRRDADSSEEDSDADSSEEDSDADSSEEDSDEETNYSKQKEYDGDDDLQHDSNDSSEEKDDDNDSDEKEDDDNDSDEKEDHDIPVAFLRMKARHTSGDLLQPLEVTKVMLTNFQKARMSFFLTVTPFTEGDECGAGSFGDQFYTMHLSECRLKHKQNAEKICWQKCPRCRSRHQHGRRREHGRRHGHGGRPGYEDRRRRGVRYDLEEQHGYDGRRQEHHEHRGHRYPLRNRINHIYEVETNDTLLHFDEPLDNSTILGTDQDKNTTPFESTTEPAAEGNAAACNTTVEGWLGPESKMVISYTPSTCGCIIIRAYVSYPISNGTLVLTPEGNSGYLEHFDCVQPNPTPEDDDSIEDYENDSSEIYNDDEVSLDGIDISNIIGQVDDQGLIDEDEEDDDDDDEDDDEEDSFTPRRGREGYNLRPRNYRYQDISEEVEDDNEDDADYVPPFEIRRRHRRAPDDEGTERLSWQERRYQKNMRREQRREARQHRRMGNIDTSPYQEGYSSSDEESANIIENPRHVRRLMRDRRRNHRRHRDRDEEIGTNDTATEAPLEDNDSSEEDAEGRGRSNRHHRRRHRQYSSGMGTHRHLFRTLNDPGERFCCKQGIQHKKASTYSLEDGTYPEVDCDIVPSEVPIWANHKHAIVEDSCQTHYRRCCDTFNLNSWEIRKQKLAMKRKIRRERRRGRHH